MQSVEQALCTVDDALCAGVLKQTADLREIEIAWPCQNGQSPGCRLKAVVAASRNEAAANKGDIRGAQQQQQLAHGVAKQYLAVAGGGSLKAASRIAQFRLLNLSGNAVKAFRVAGYKNQQRVGKLRQELSMRVQQNAVFTVVGAGGNPGGARAHCLAQCKGLLAQGVRNADIEFDTAGYAQRVRAHPQGGKALRIGPSLGNDAVHGPHHWPTEAAEPLIAAG